jgi:hypothetical protein
MVRRSLIAAALLAVAAPLTAQSLPGPVEWQWTSDRPDANAPQGVYGARTLEESEIEIGYRFYQTNWRGVYFGTDSLDLATTLQLYDDVPLQKSDIRHQLRVAWGLSDNLTLMARGEFAVMERETVANNGLIRTTAEELGDVELDALYNVYDNGPYRLHVQLGAALPTGTTRTYADTTRAQSGTMTTLPYDMRPGGGTFGAILGITGSVQNEFGSIGAQFKLRSNFGTNGAGYTLGDQHEANGWAAYNLNQSVSISGGVRWENWSQISGEDTTLKPSGDPENLGALRSGQRALMPLGINFRLPADSRFGGHMLSLEAVYALHHDYEGPQLGMDWGLNFGWNMSF